MTELPFRTNVSDLTDGELIILDVLFDCVCRFRHLVDSVFESQWNLPYSHGLSDSRLDRTLSSLCERGILRGSKQAGDNCYQLTSTGGDIWSSERLPDWNRFCCERYRSTLCGQTMMTVVAVSPNIRDDFIKYWPMYPAQSRTATVEDCGLVPWKKFKQLHVGVAVYREEHEWRSAAESEDYRKRFVERQQILEDNRSWWRVVPELQRFVGNSL